MRYFVRLIAIVCAGVAALQAGPAEAERRLALAVGIDVYDHLPAHEQLRKAVNDARAVGAELRELGFDATVEENLPRLGFVRAWQRFLNRLEPGDTAALFFAGHGVEIGGLNYLLPRDVPRVVAGEDQVLAEASIRFNGLMDSLRDKKVRVALFIVDACRDNPFRDGRGRSVGGTRGLARIEPAKGSFVMYSAGAGEQALDRLSDADRDANSVYTRTLLPILKTPGLSLPEIAGRVRRKVVDVARGVGREQTPAYYDELLGDFVLKVGTAADARPPTALQPPPSDAERAWAAARDSTNIAVLEAFRRQYGAANAFYDRLAEARIDELKRQQLAMLKAEEDKRRAEEERRRAEEERKRAEEARRITDQKERAAEEARKAAERLKREREVAANTARIAGRWFLRQHGQPYSAPLGAFTIEVRGSTILARGDGWSGAGTFDGQRGYYDWRFTDGKTGRTTIWIEAGERLLGQVRGSGIDWDYVATRQ